MGTGWAYLRQLDGRDANGVRQVARSCALAAGADEEEGALKTEMPLVAMALFTPLHLPLRLCASCRRLQRTAATHCV
jgi:hypothetical protein